MMRDKGYIGSVINSVELANRVRAIATAMHGDDASFIDVDPMPLLMLSLKSKDAWGNTQLAFVNTEGVGDAAEFDTVAVWFYYRNGDMATSVQVSVKLLASMATNETEDLSEWVRTFGARLDSNVRIWQNQMSKPVLTH